MKNTLKKKPSEKKEKKLKMNLHYILRILAKGDQFDSVIDCG